MFDREFDQRGAATQSQLCRDVVAMMVNRAGADIQFGGNLTAGAAFGNQLQDAAFGGRSLLGCGFLCGKRCGAMVAVDQEGDPKQMSSARAMGGNQTGQQ